MGDSVFKDTVQANRRQLSVVICFACALSEHTRIRPNITCRTSEAEIYSRTFVKSLSKHTHLRKIVSKLIQRGRDVCGNRTYLKNCQLQLEIIPLLLM